MKKVVKKQSPKPKKVAKKSIVKKVVKKIIKNNKKTDEDFVVNDENKFTHSDIIMGYSYMSKMNINKLNENINHKIITGDSRNMSEIQDKTVDLVVTSPPYWQLKDYGEKKQIGFNDSYEEYINNLNLVWSECFRVLDDGCRLCVNIGDQFARSVYYGRYKIIPIHSEIIRFCENIGFDFMGSIIWQKQTTMNTSGGASIMGSFPYPKNGIVKLDFEYILLFKKPGKSNKIINKEDKEKSKMTNEEWNKYFNGHWYFSGARQDKHIAMFPEELPSRLIKMFSFYGENVLDPFMGSGTTSAVAEKLGRKSIGYEINKDFIPTIKEKILKSNPLTKIIFEKQKEYDMVNKYMYEKLPYFFKDVLKLDKKIDVTKLKFGSKIQKGDSSKREEIFIVKEIINGEMLKLSNDLIVKLLGIKQYKENHLAMNFLNNKIKGKKVFIKYDTIKYDKDNNLLVYLYLENKTFVNAHLLKNKCASVDNQIDFKYKIKFNELLKNPYEKK